MPLSTAKGVPKQNLVPEAGDGCLCGDMSDWTSLPGLEIWPTSMEERWFQR